MVTGKADEQFEDNHNKQKRLIETQNQNPNATINNNKTWWTQQNISKGAQQNKDMSYPELPERPEYPP